MSSGIAKIRKKMIEVLVTNSFENESLTICVQWSCQITALIS